MSASDCKRSYLYTRDVEAICEECGFKCADHQFAGTLRFVNDLFDALEEAKAPKTITPDYLTAVCLAKGCPIGVCNHHDGEFPEGCPVGAFKRATQARNAELLARRRK